MKAASFANPPGGSAPCYDALVSTSRPARPLATKHDLLTRSGPPAEVIGGEIVEKAVPSPEHGSAQFALSGQLFSPFGSSRGSGSPGGWWLMTEVEAEYETHEVYRHDHLGFRKDRHPERPTGRPDTVRKLRTLLEHKSPTTGSSTPNA